MLFHVFRHIQPHQTVHTVKEVVCQTLDKLGLAHTGGADKNEGHGTLLGGNPHPVPADSLCHRLHRFVLADNMGFQPGFQLAQLLVLLGLDLGGGDLRPHLNNPGQILHGHGGLGLGFQLFDLLGQLAELAADLGQALIILVLGVFVQHPKLQLVVVPLLFQLRKLRDLLAPQIHVAARLVQQVDGLIRQEPVRNIPFGEHHTLPGNLRRNAHAVKFRIAFRDALHDLHGFLNGGLRHRHRLEPAFQSGILLDVLPVLIEGGRADDLNLSPGKRGLEDVGGVHAALRVTGPHQIVDLVDYKDNIATLPDLLNETLHPAFKLAPELGASHQRGQIQEENLLIPQLIGHIPRGNPLGKALGDGGFAHARLTDETGIVLLAAVEDLNDPLRLHIPADHLVELSLPGTARQVHAVAVQEFMALAFFLRIFFLFPVFFPGGRPPYIGVAGTSEHLVQQRKGRGLTVNFIVLGFPILPLAEHAAHFVAEQIQVLFGDAHLLDCLVDLGNAQAPGTLQTVALIHGYAVFHLRNEDHGNILFAFGTHFWLHCSHTPYTKDSFLFPQYSTLFRKKGKQIINTAGRRHIQIFPLRYHTTDGSCKVPPQARWARRLSGSRWQEYRRSPPGQSSLPRRRPPSQP